MAKVNWSERETRSGFPACRLTTVLREARRATGRNRETGRIEPGRAALSGNWLGAVGYLLLIDRVGSACRPPGPPVVRALRSCAPRMGESEREALYALRCSLVHDFGLVNVGGPGRTHHFMLDDFRDGAERPGPVVRLPPEPWDGRVEHCRRFNATWVDLRALGDLAEEVFAGLHPAGEPAGPRRRYPVTHHPGPALSTRAASGDRKPVGGGT
jgi:hypothetical protein